MIINGPLTVQSPWYLLVRGCRRMIRAIGEVKQLLYVLFDNLLFLRKAVLSVITE